MSGDRDPNESPTTSEVAAAYWEAHARLKAEMMKRLGEMRDAGYVGWVDVGWFWPFAPVALHRSGKAKGSTSSSIGMTLFPVDSKEAPLPFGWVRYEVDGSAKIRVVARGDASQ